MKSILLLCFCLSTAAQEADVETSFVPSTLPVYVNGQRVDPTNGGHKVSLSRETGVSIDGVAYIPVSKFPPYVPGTRADGLYHAADGAHRAANPPLEAGKGRAEAKQAMLAFWKREFGDSLIVTERGEYGFDLTYHGQTVMIEVPDIGGYHPENQLVDNFELCRARYQEIVAELQNGFLIVCGRGYLVLIRPSDAEKAMPEISTVAKRAQSITLRPGEIVYSPQELLGGKYVFTNSAVKDFVAQQEQ